MDKLLHKTMTYMPIYIVQSVPKQTWLQVKCYILYCEWRREEPYAARERPSKFRGSPRQQNSGMQKPEEQLKELSQPKNKKIRQRQSEENRYSIPRAAGETNAQVITGHRWMWRHWLTLEQTEGKERQTDLTS